MSGKSSWGRVWVVVTMLSGALMAQGGQGPAALAGTQDGSAAAKTPADLYKEAMHPLEVVRTSLDNWSDAELGALALGMHMAGVDCAQMKAEDYKDDSLYGLARLCTFGQDWNGANRAALAYVAGGDEEHRAQAYALSVNALTHMNALGLAVETEREMLIRLPYDAEVAYSARNLKNDLEQSLNPAALTVAGDEHPRIVAALQKGVPLKAAHGDAVMSVSTLYESAMQLAFLDRYAGNDRQAEAVAAEVEGALPAAAVLTAEERQRVTAVAARFRLLGGPLPEVKALRALQSAAAKVRIDTDFGSATVLVLFPDWCVGCRQMMKALTEFAAVNRDTPIHAYGLVFADDAMVYGQEAHEQNFKQMRGTLTLVVPAETARRFGATEFPLGIVVDKAGTVRFIGPLPGGAFNGDSYVGKVIVRMVSAASGMNKRIGKAN